RGNLLRRQPAAARLDRERLGLLAVHERHRVLRAGVPLARPAARRSPIRPAARAALATVLSAVLAAGLARIVWSGPPAAPPPAAIESVPRAQAAAFAI